MVTSQLPWSSPASATRNPGELWRGRAADTVRVCFATTVEIESERVLGLSWGFYS